MNKIVFCVGIAVFILGALAFFLSGSTSGPSPEEMKPTVPFLYGTNQTIWMMMAFAGVAAIVIGAVLKGKKKR